jgi:hypothetical protein
LVRRLNQAVPGHYDCLHSRETGRNNRDDGRCSIVAMHDVRARTPKRSVQTAHEMKKRRRMVESNVKAFGLKFYAKHTK